MNDCYLDYETERYSNCDGHWRCRCETPSVPCLDCHYCDWAQVPLRNYTNKETSLVNAMWQNPFLTGWGLFMGGWACPACLDILSRARPDLVGFIYQADRVL